MVRSSRGHRKGRKGRKSHRKSRSHRKSHRGRRYQRGGMLPFNEIGQTLTPELQAQAGVAPLTAAIADAEAIAGRYNPIGAHGMYQKGGEAPFGYSLPREMVGLPTTFDRTAEVIGVKASEQIGGRRKSHMKGRKVLPSR